VFPVVETHYIHTGTVRYMPFCCVTKELVSGGGNHFYKHGSPDHITERQIERDRKRQKETERDRKRQNETERDRKRQ
jgi:hypothetical protein